MYIYFQRIWLEQGLKVVGKNLDKDFEIPYGSTYPYEDQFFFPGMRIKTVEEKMVC